jgi:hypothetical protein
VTPAVRVGSPAQRGAGASERVVERILPATPGAARLARASVQVACSSWRISSVCEVAVLAVSELVGNAVRHGPSNGGTLTLRVSMTTRRLRVEVVDASPGRPTVKRPPAEAEGGPRAVAGVRAGDPLGRRPRPGRQDVWVEIAL